MKKWWFGLSLIASFVLGGCQPAASQNGPNMVQFGPNDTPPPTKIVPTQFVAPSITPNNTPVPHAAFFKLPAGADILFEDKFTDPGSGWDRMTDDHGITDYIKGGYRILVKSPNYDVWVTPQKDFTDVILTVDAAKVAGPDENNFGVLCRYQDITHFYLLEITSDGYAGIFIKNGSDVALISELKMQTSKSIHMGNLTNHILGACVGNVLSLWVNEEKVKEVTDNTFSHGDIGLLAGSYDQGGTDITFSNLVVKKP